jgi:hypothetical protein
LQETGTGAASLKAFKANFQPVVTPVQVNVNIDRTDSVTVTKKAQDG